MRRRGSKYGNVKTTLNGITFDSEAESRRWLELKLLEKAGEIWDLERQPVFQLFAPSTTGVLRHALNGRSSQLIGTYLGDFKYRDKTCDGSTYPYIVEDVKGVLTALYKWKKKHVEAQYGITIREVRMR